MDKLEHIIVSPGASIVEAITQLEEAGTGALALCTEGRKLVGLMTDGDIRRAILRGLSLDDPCETIANLNPIVTKGPMSGHDALQLMTQREINHLPVVDADGTLIEFFMRKDLVSESPLDLTAVIMAGGFGQRLMPLTENVPKPMLPVGERPLLERTIQQLRRSGIREVNLTTHYLAESIIEHFGDGEAFGMKLTYSNEDQPLGTAGGLKLAKRSDGPVVVVNGDILTGVSFQDMVRFHRKCGADITVGVRKHDISVPFGVVECEDVWVCRLREKPKVTLLINAGLYVIEPTAYDFIPDGQRFDMTDLIKRMLDEGRRVASFPVIEYWQDVGRLEDYRQAQEDALNGRI